jgi:hypothetical protein
VAGKDRVSCSATKGAADTVPDRQAGLGGKEGKHRTVVRAVCLLLYTWPARLSCELLTGFILSELTEIGGTHFMSRAESGRT